MGTLQIFAGCYGKSVGTRETSTCKDDMQVGFILSRYDVKYKQPGSYLDNGLGGVFDNQPLQNGPFLHSHNGMPVKK
jgi:hypothetical protein